MPADLRQRIVEAATVLKENRATPDSDVPRPLWNKASCVIVVPGLKKAAFVFGGEYGKGLMVRQQMFYAATSLELHRRDPEGLDTTRLVAELQERYTPFRHVEGTYFHESFGHHSSHLRIAAQLASATVACDGSRRAVRFDAPGHRATG